MYYVIYELADKTEQVFGPFSSEQLKYERASAEYEKHDPKSQVVDYRVTTTDPRTAPSQPDTQ